MADPFDNLNNPWLVAVWPGMGSVAMLAGSHLAAELDAEVVMEMPGDEFFEMQHVEVSDGIAVAGHLPRNLFLLWRDPEGRQDLIIFVGEAQPQHNGFTLCQRIAAYAGQWNVRRITTFAAMATQLHPADDAGVFAVATNPQLAAECAQHDMQLLKQGQVSGLNGLMLAAAAEHAIPGLCLMGEMPYFAVNLPNPPAALAALRAFAELSGVDLDLSSLADQADHVRQQLEHMVERLSSPDAGEDDEIGFSPQAFSHGEEHEPDPDEPVHADLDPESRRWIESLFEQVRQDRSKAMRLKSELDRLGVFKQYEDRFLDLFRKGG